MSLPDVWFVIIAISWTVFFLLEGFDFGVGMLHRVIPRSEDERRVAINTIGPFWDGNEVWLVVGGAAIFAAFPGWYATWFSAGYLALLVLLVALIIRGVSFEFRGKVDSGRWRGTWSGTLAIGSLVVPLVIGVALGDLLAGLPIDSNQEFTGNFWDLFTPYGVWTGVTLLVLCLLNGATFLGLRTTGDLRDRANRTGRLLAVLAIVVLVIFAGWTINSVDAGVGADIGLVLAPVGAVAALVSLGRERDVPAFVATALAMAATVASLFASLYPDVMVSSTDAAYNLTVEGTASGDYALKVMTVVAAVFLPIVLLYQAWSYVVFRHRLTAPPLSPEPTVALDSR
jgi:cytochrome bd ubiquinol oxidase subunit II